MFGPARVRTRLERGIGKSFEPRGAFMLANECEVKRKPVIEGPRHFGFAEERKGLPRSNQGFGQLPLLSQYRGEIAERKAKRLLGCKR